ncbi:hypothetical protein V6N13_027149 [Hibiscus sabdariffa]
MKTNGDGDVVAQTSDEDVVAQTIGDDDVVAQTTSDGDDVVMLSVALLTCRIVFVKPLPSPFDCDLDVEPRNPNISYSCGADGVVNHIDLRIYAPATKLFTCQPIDDAMHIHQFIPLDHIAVDPLNPNLFAVSGSDKYTRLYDILKCMRDSSTDFDQFIDHFYLPHLIGEHLVVVTGMAFSDHSELLVSYSDSSVCLFTRDMGLGHDPVPFSPFSARNEASEKVIPQLYRGSAKFESGKAVTFLGPKSSMWLWDPIMTEYLFGRRKAESLSVLWKGMKIVSILSSLICRLIKLTLSSSVSITRTSSPPFFFQINIRPKSDPITTNSDLGPKKVTPFALSNFANPL